MGTLDSWAAWSFLRTERPSFLGGADDSLRFWDVSSRKQKIVTRPAVGSMETFANLSFAADGKSLAGSGTWSDRVRVFDALNGNERQELSLRGIRGLALLSRVAAGIGMQRERANSIRRSPIFGGW